jgi:GTP-binding protein
MKDSQANDPLPVRSLDFLGGMAAAGGWRPPTTLPEIAFAGRSNVGKSSLLNLLIRRKAFARVSHTPGRTREINFFEVNHEFILVDLPGYGYARLSKERRQEWRPLIEGYLKGATQLRGLVLLIDARRDPTNEDRQMLDFLAEIGIPTLVVLTKMDKVGRAEVDQRVAAIVAALELDEEQVIQASARTGHGRNELAEALMSILAPATP